MSAVPRTLLNVTSSANDQALQSRLEDLVAYRRQYLTGDEKGEAQVFCDRLFQALGHGGIREAGATLEMRLRRFDNGGTAFADLMWKPRCLMEMKKAGTDLAQHFRQAFDYWAAAVPDRPRYVILCNFDEFWIYDFNNQLDAPVDRIGLDQLPKRADAIAFMLPEPQEPVFGNDLVAVTRDAARKVGSLFLTLHNRGVDRGVAQRFVLQSVVAMFAEDIGLLPGKYFTRALQDSRDGSDAYDLLFGLFREMNTPGITAGGRYRGTQYFNGGIFASVMPVELQSAELELLHEAVTTDWSDVRPEIFGTLFEGSMDAGERHAEGAHFTSQADIAKAVGPTIVAPWRERLSKAKSISDLEQAMADMATYRVLDPACGSGNFLYVAYREMRRLEHECRAMIVSRRRSAAAAAQASFSFVTPDHFYGIDINPFAVEVAKVTMMLAKKLAADELMESQPVLPLDNLDSTIVTGDALFMNWPKAHAIVGNPPYLGRRKMQDELGATYTRRLASTFPEVGGVSDYVTYWFPLTHDRLPAGGRAGLVATNTVRENDSRKVSLDYIVDNDGVITEAVSSQPWSGDAQVHVSIINWMKATNNKNPPKNNVLWLNNGELRLELPSIPPTLSPAVDVRSAVSLPPNTSPVTCFQGQTPGVTRGFVIDLAQQTRLRAELHKTTSVIHPFLGGDELLKTLEIERYVIDLPYEDIVDARRIAEPVMTHLEATVLPVRRAAAEREEERNRQSLADNPNATTNRHHAAFLNRWWQLGYRRSEMLDALNSIDRYIATSRVASERRMSVFDFIDASIRPGDSLTVIALDDDYSFGIVSSEIHRVWLKARCSTLETRLRYTTTTVWDSFPWPQNLNADIVSNVTSIVKELLGLRISYLKEGTSLATQYDALRDPGESKLRDLHSELDDAVLIAFGFTREDDVLAQLLALNQDIARDPTVSRGPGAEGLTAARVTQFRRQVDGWAC